MNDTQPHQPLSVQIRESETTFITRDEAALKARVYHPHGEGPFPVIIAIHGGGWRLANTRNYAHLGRRLAALGYLFIVPTYRLATRERPGYPDAVHDVRAAVQYVRADAGAFDAAPERIALMGDSSGAHLATLVALAGDAPLFAGEAANGQLEVHSTRVKAAIPVYGIFDMAAQWQHDQTVRFADHITQAFLGVSLTDDRRPYFDASPLSHVTARNAATAFLIAWGSADDVVDSATQSEAFVTALKQAAHFVRTVPVVGAPHHWISDPLDEPGSWSAFFAARLERFLAQKL